MVRKVGEILSHDFGWPTSLIEESLQEQAQDPNRRVLGEYLRQRASHHGAVSVHDVVQALTIQQAEKEMEQQRAQLNFLEYQELGELYRFERTDISRKIRAYAWTMTALFLFIGYTLSYGLDSESASAAGQAMSNRAGDGGVPPEVVGGHPESSQSGAVVESAHPEPGGADWVGIFWLYAGLGLSLVIFCVFLGDNLIKSYGQFLKRRMRITTSRALIREYAVSELGATPTVMPGAGLGGGTAAESARRSTDLLHLQKYLPIYYSAWSVLKIGLAAYFLACLFEGGFRVSRDNLFNALVLLACFMPAWTYLVSKMCLRYHKLIKQALNIDLRNPNPKLVEAVRGEAMGGAEVGTGKARSRRTHFCLYGALGLLLAGGSVLWALGNGDYLKIGSKSIEAGFVWLGMIWLSVFGMFLVRVLEVKDEMENVAVLPAINPSSKRGS